MNPNAPYQPAIWYSCAWRSPGVGRLVTYPRTREAIGHSRDYASGRGWPVPALPDHIARAHVGANIAPKWHAPFGDVAVVSLGILILSPKLAEVLGRFDLGATRLHPLELRQEASTKVIDQRVWLNVAETKACLVPDTSFGLLPIKDPHPEMPHQWRLGRAVPRLAVRETAAEGVDLWMDPLVGKILFFSDRLATALRDEGFDLFDFQRCRIVAA
ncbi:MAG: hypothetical protein AAF674_01585 [Pseudomonadota bacterium]